MKHNMPVEINFETGTCEETVNSKILYNIERIKAINNPYVGNKRKILFDIADFLNQEEVVYDRFLDLFSGSAAVSILMKLIGRQVFSNDILRSSYMYAKAFSENNEVTLSDKMIDRLLNRNASCDFCYDDFVARNFSARFTNDECKFLDNFRANIYHLDNEYEEALAFASIQLHIIDRCFVGGRLNSGQVLAKLDHRINHNRNGGCPIPFNKIKWIDFNCSKMQCNNKTFNLDATQLLDSLDSCDIDLVYIDPPYGGQQSDYAHMYSFFESYIDNKLNIADVASKKFCSSKQYKDNFVKLLNSANKFPAIMISYNDSSWSVIDEIKSIVGQFKSDIIVKEIEYDYKYRNKKNKSGVEYIILAR